MSPLYELCYTHTNMDEDLFCSQLKVRNPRTAVKSGNTMVLFSLFLTSKRDTTLFLNKPFFCDKWLRLWFYITAIQIIYMSKEVYSQQAEERLKLCVTEFKKTELI